MKITKDFAWVHYSADKVTLDNAKVGKWMTFFPNDMDSIKYMQEVCEWAIKREIVQSVKHTYFGALFGPPQGVACFYMHGDDDAAHRRVIAYFLEKDLIMKTKSGRLYNISFKYDEQTREGQYGNDFVAEIKLDRFLNLSTREWLDKQ